MTPSEGTPRLYCPAGLAARASRRSVLVALAIVALVLTAIALGTPWGARGALLAFVTVWGAWMVVMPVVLVVSALRGSRRTAA